MVSWTSLADDGDDDSNLQLAVPPQTMQLKWVEVHS
jgi:hypothetical protein